MSNQITADEARLNAGAASKELTEHEQRAMALMDAFHAIRRRSFRGARQTNVPCIPATQEWLVDELRKVGYAVKTDGKFVLNVKWEV